MQSPDEERLKRVGLFMALAAMIQAAEAVIPTPLPWFRLGLGNAVILAGLVLMGVRDGFFIAGGKVLLGGLLSGKLFSYPFFFSLGGTLAGTTAMAAALTLGLPLGFIGVSVLGAVAHALAQLYVAEYLLQTAGVWVLAPIMGGLSVISAIISGGLAAYLARALKR